MLRQCFAQDPTPVGRSLLHDHAPPPPPITAIGTRFASSYGGDWGRGWGMIVQEPAPNGRRGLCETLPQTSLCAL